MLRYRIQSGLLLGAALLAAVFFLPPIGVLAILLFVGYLALVEFYAFLDARQIPHFKIVGIVAGLVLIAGTWFAMRGSWTYRFDVESFILFAATCAIFIRQIMLREGDRPWDTLAGTLLGIVYVAYLFNFFVKLLTGWGDLEGRYLLLYLAIVVKFTDIGAYSVGCAIGRHKLIPRISPAKTWEGVAGGVLTGLLASLLYWRLGGGHMGNFRFAFIDAVRIGLLLPVAGIAGDLIESLLKRAAGVKDSGRIILGMGGILDVIDSMLFAAPVLYIYARLLLSPPL